MKINPSWSERRHYVGRCSCPSCFPYLEENFEKDMKAKEYILIERCVEDGIARGMYRAYKHNDSPTEEQIKTEIQNEVMNEISEWFTFEEFKND